MQAKHSFGKQMHATNKKKCHHNDSNMKPTVGQKQPWVAQRVTTQASFYFVLRSLFLPPAWSPTYIMTLIKTVLDFLQ